MKTIHLQKGLAILTIAGLATASAVAQSTAATATPAPAAITAPVAAPAPQLSYGVSQILQLTQAKVGDDTIVAYVRNSGNSYGLDANQIIYLRQNGVSDPVITAMLNQPKPPTAPAQAPAAASSYNVPAPTTAAPPVDYSAVADSSAAVAPSVTYVQTYPSYYYSQPYYSYPYYYGYGWYPGVTIGWGGYYGGGWRGGWHGGGGGGGWHGGGGGGGWHGGGGGGHH